MEEYLRILLEQIRCRKARPYIRQELQNHMEDQIQANIQAGMDEVRAEKEAVRDMGDFYGSSFSGFSSHVCRKCSGVISEESYTGISGR